MLELTIPMVQNDTNTILLSQFTIISDKSGYVTPDPQGHNYPLLISHLNDTPIRDFEVCRLKNK